MLTAYKNCTSQGAYGYVSAKVIKVDFYHQTSSHCCCCIYCVFPKEEPGRKSQSNLGDQISSSEDMPTSSSALPAFLVKLLYRQWAESALFISQWEVEITNLGTLNFCLLLVLHLILEGTLITLVFLMNSQHSACKFAMHPKLLSIVIPLLLS